jgi:DNA mismatch repair protein MSH5
MAIDMGHNSTVGCAHYNTADGLLSLSDDIPMASMDVVEHILLHVEPTTLLVSGRAPEVLMDFLQAQSQAGKFCTTRSAGWGNSRLTC